MLLNFPSPDLAAELTRRQLAPPCHCGTWPLTLSGYDGRTHNWRCAGCLLLPEKCLCPRAPAGTVVDQDAGLDVVFLSPTGRPESAENADNQGVSLTGRS